LTTKERMLAVYNNQQPYYIPVSIYSRFLKRGTQEREARRLGMGIIDYVPITSLIAPPWHLTQGFFSEVKNAEFNIRYIWQNGEISEIRTINTPVGSVSQHLRKDPSYGTDWVDKFYIACPEDYKVMQYIIENTISRPNEKALLKKQNELGDDGVVLGRLDRCPFQKMLIEIAGPEQFLVDIATDFAPAIELLEVLEKKMDEQLDIAVNSAAEIFWSPENVTCDMTPPYYYEKYCLPHYKKRAERLNKTNKPLFLHFDGRLKPLTRLIADTPINGIESYSLPLVGNDLSFSEAQEAWPGKAILPNFPSTLCLKDDSEIEAFLEQMLTEILPQTSVMLQISEDLPEEHYYRVSSLLVRFMREKGRY